jgi:DNA-directed RNA polymerase sigma subunit (sigma70/sigma32)
LALASEVAVQPALEVYEAELRRLTEGANCTDPWFTEQLARARTGDEDAGRAICGSCLKLVLEIAKKEWRAESPLNMLEWVQEGNAVLMKFVKRFTGSGAEEFLRQLGQQIPAWFTLLTQHPEWARMRWA